MPWSEESLPRDDDIFSLFQFNPKMRKGCETSEINEDTELEVKSEGAEGEENTTITWGSLSCFRASYEAHEFFRSLRQVFCPANEMCIGSGAMNSVPFFSLAKLAPGWVGGYMSGLVHT